MSSGWRAAAGIALCAALFGLYARGGNAYVLGFVALVPWLLAMNATRTLSGAAASGLAMCVAFTAAVFAWFGFAIAKFTGLSPPSGLLALLAAAPLLQPQFIVFALARHFAGRHHGPLLRALAGASAWVATEWLYPKLLGDTLGHGLYPSHIFRQIADVGGAAGITFLLILINECVAETIASRHDGKRAWRRPLAVGISLLVVMGGYGLIRWSALNAVPTSDIAPLRVGMVQSNIVDYERLRREMGAYEVVRHVLDTHYAMSREAVERHHVDALLWSETVYPTTFAHPKSEAGAELDREILGFVSSIGVPLVFGTYDLDDQGEYNAAAFVAPPADTLGFYRKTRLFLLSEYVPAWLDGPKFREWFPWTGTWRPGAEARVFPLRLADGREVPVLPMICLDDVDTGLGLDGARLGAQAIVGMSNDSWFTEHPEGVDLHLRVAAFRSLETRLPQLRVTNNGISAVINPAGTIVAATGMSEQKLLVGEIRPASPPATLMVSWGDWVGRAGLALLALLAASAWVRAFRARAVRGSRPAATDIAFAEGVYRTHTMVLTPAWRVLAALLRGFARASLLWMGAEAVIGEPSQSGPIARMWMFAGLFLAPEIAAWALLRACATTMSVEDGTLVLEQRERRIEIPAAKIVALRLWRLPLPAMGLWLRLESGRRGSYGIVTAEPDALAEALVRAGGRPALAAQSATGFVADYARTRRAVPRRWFDHPLLKFVLFALVPALPAFRLHQIIAYGGTFGEYYTYGLKAYLTALLIWWASWVINLALFAAALRAVIEAVTLLSIAVRRDSARAVRNALEFLGRLIFYAGIPAWLLLRLLS